MRRYASPLSLALLGTGVFLLVLAPLLAWYVEPRAERTPIDVNATTISTGNGSYFDPDVLVTRDNRQLTVTQRVVGDVADSEDSGNAIWDVSTQVDTPKTAPLRDPRRSFQWTVERWVTDRRTNLPVHCCEEKPSFEGEAYLKFPFGLQRRTYRWWDPTLGAPVPLRFAGVTKVLGLEGYRFTGTVAPTRTGTMQVPGRLVGRPLQGQVYAERWYANSGVELVAEPRTGRIIDARISPKVTLRAPGGGRDAVTLLQSDGLVFTEKTKREQVDLASRDSAKLELLGDTVPVSGGAAGGVLAAAGATLAARGRSRPERSEVTGT